MLKKGVYSILLSVMLFACVEKQQENYTTLFSTEADYEDSCTTNKVKGNAYSGDYYSRVDGKTVYGAGITYFVPLNITSTMMRVCVDFYCKRGGVDFGQKVVLTLQKGDSVIVWKEFALSGTEVGDKEWFHFVDSTQFLYNNPAKKFMQIRVFAYGRYTKSYVEMDNLKVTIKEVFTGERKKQEKNKNIIIAKFIDFEDTLVMPRKRGCAFNGKYYSHVDGKLIYGAGIIYDMPDSLINAKLRVKLNYFCRTDTLGPFQKMVVSVQNNDTLLFWKEFAIEKYRVSTKQWTNITDSVQFIYKNYGRKNVQLKVFAYNVSKEAYIDLDDLNIEVEKVFK